MALQRDVWRYSGTFGVTEGRLALQRDVWRYRRTFGVTEGRLALPGDVWRYPGTFGVTADGSHELKMLNVSTNALKRMAYGKQRSRKMQGCGKSFTTSPRQR